MASSVPQLILSGKTLKLNDSVYELYKPAEEIPELDLVFFHGLQWGDPRDAFLTTWMTSCESEAWVNTWLVEEFPKARVLSVCYNLSASSCPDESNLDMYTTAGESLAGSIIELAKVGEGCPVVMVGHSLGGLVLKEVCLQAHRLHYADPSRMALAAFLENLRGAFFFATPHSGSLGANVLGAFSAGPLLDTLKLMNSQAVRVNAEFSNLRKLHGWKTCGVGEANKTYVLGVFHSMVVDESSAKKDMDMFSVVPGADHTSICKPDERSSSSYVLVIHFIRSCLPPKDIDSSMPIAPFDNKLPIPMEEKAPATQTSQSNEAMRFFHDCIRKQESERPAPQLSIRSRFPRAPCTAPTVPKVKARDWSLIEMKKLISAKRQEFEYITFGNSSQKKIAAGKEKWKWIAQFILQEGVTDPIRDAGSCKKKWEKLVGDWKRVYDYEKNIPPGYTSYYKMLISERKKVGLPINFSEEIYRDIEDWFPSRHEVDPSGMSISIMDSSAMKRERPMTAEDNPVDGGSEDPAEVEEDPVEDPADPEEEDIEEDEDGDLPSPGPSHPSAPSEGASDATPSTDGSKGKRKRSSGTTRDAEENSIHANTSQLLEILKEDSVRRNLHNEAELQLHRETVRMHREIVEMQREVGLANAASLQANAMSIQRVADALLQLVATRFRSPDD